MAEPFAERAATMGLDVAQAYKGLFSYNDRHSEVVYRILGPTCFSEDPEEHPTDRNLHKRSRGNGLQIRWLRFRHL